MIDPAGGTAPPEPLAPERINALLAGAGSDGEVTAVRAERVGAGQIGTSYRLHLTWADAEGSAEVAGRPATMVAKVPGGPPELRATLSGTFRTEVAFYRHIAPTVALRVPACHGSEISDDASDFVLLLEDMSPAVQGDQLAGCGPADAERAVVSLAGLHGPRWCDRTLGDQEPLAVPSPDDAARLAQIYGGATDLFLARFAGSLTDGERTVLVGVAAVMGEWLLARTSPFGLVHGDFRLDNLMFGPAGEVTTLDWQTVNIGLPARDLAYFCATCLSPDDRRAHEDALIARYHGALAGHGVAGHSVGACRDDYRFGLLQAPLTTVLGCAFGSPTERGDRMFLAMAQRFCAAIDDHGVLARLGCR